MTESSLLNPFVNYEVVLEIQLGSLSSPCSSVDWTEAIRKVGSD